MRSRILVLSMTLAAALASLPAGATTLVRMTLSQLSQASSTIVQGRVVSQQMQWNAAHTRIVTLTTVEVGRALKGQPASTLVIEQLGGTVGNFHVRVPGTAYLRPQTDYILFLEPSGNAQDYHVVGMVQGALPITSNGNGLERRVILPLGALRTGNSRVLSPSPTLGEFQMTLSGVLRAPIVIPSGTLMPVLVQSTQFHGAGQVSVVGRTTSDLFPSHSVVIPAGSEVQGIAQRVGKNWKIYWNSVSVRGREAKISGTSQVPEGESLEGSSFQVSVR